MHVQYIESLHFSPCHLDVFHDSVYALMVATEGSGAKLKMTSCTLHNTTWCLQYIQS